MKIDIRSFPLILAARLLLVLGAATLAVSPQYPFWRLRLVAPQYPRGLTVLVYPDRIVGDVSEIDLLNHYIGMRELEQAAPRERQMARPAIATLAVCMVIAALLPWRRSVLLLVPVILFPPLFLADLWWWLRDSGLHLDPKAPLSTSIKPFVPQLLGEGKIAQFRTHGSLDTGFYLCLAAGLASLLFCWLRLRRPHTQRCRPFEEAKVKEKAAALASLCLLFLAGSAQSDTLIVTPQGTPYSIDQALQKAMPGDTIVLRGGVYKGPFVIKKAMRLVGEDHPILDGGGRGTVVQLEAPGILLKGVTIRNSGDLLANEDAGVLVAAPGVHVEENQFQDVLFGVYVRRAPGSVVRANHFQGKALPVPRRGDLIRLWYSDGATIEDNRVHGGRDAVLWYSKHLTIRNNTIEAGRYGLHFMYCHDAQVTGNRLMANSVGAFLMYSRRLRLENNWIADNRGPSGYGIGLKDMDDTVADKNVLAGNRVGLFLEQVRGRFEGNLIAGNDRGMVLFPSARGNRFADNSFVENGEQVTIEGGAGLMTSNTWEGNFWSDYRGGDRDGDGFGDLPYRPSRLFEHLADRNSALRWFTGSPSVEAIDFAARLLPIFEPQPKFIDPHPRMSPLPSPLPVPNHTRPRSWLLAAIGLLFTPLSLVLGVRWLPHLPRSLRVEPRITRTEDCASETAAGSSPVLAASGLTKRFGSVLAVADLSFEVRFGECVALWGANGAGKTTILKCLLGLIPFDGTAQVQGLLCGPRSKAVRRLLGYVPQEIRLHPDQTVRETIDFYRRLRKVSRERAAQLLAEWQLQDSEEQPVRALSGGMKQKLALIIALLSDPPVMLLDEPTSNLDPQTRQELGALLERLKKAGKTVLFCSHRAGEVWRLADRVLILERGRKVAEGVPETLRQQLVKPAVLCLTVPPERNTEAASVLAAAGFRVCPQNIQLRVDVPAGRKLAPIELLIRAGVPVVDFDLESNEYIGV
jgi:nitrous oxidase accessory protein